MKLRTKIAVSSIALVASSLCIAARVETSENPTPGVQIGNKEFFTQSQIDRDWQSVVTDYPSALAPGDKFPSQAPPFFHPADTNATLYEDGLTEDIAAQYWRCSWLNAVLVGTVSEEQAQSAIDSYSSLPGVTQSDAEQYDSAVKAWSSDYHVSPFQADFDATCGVYISVHSTASKQLKKEL